MNTNNNPPPASPNPMLPLSPMTGSGQIIFRVTTAGGAIPLAGAQVVVRERRADTNTDRGNAVAVMTSDNNGKTPILALPAPPRALSMSPSPDGAPPPFACYDAEVTLSGYFAAEFVCIPIFDGITSIQPATLTPLPENGRPDGANPEDTVIFESENPDL